MTREDRTQIGGNSQWAAALVTLTLASAIAFAQTPPAQTPPPQQQPPAQNPPAQPPQTPAPFVPKPFPQPSDLPVSSPVKANSQSGPPAPAPAVPPAAAAMQNGRPTDAMLGVQVYSGAEFLESVDAGQNQRYYLFGTNAPYADVIAFYRQILKAGPRELFKAPAMHQFDIGKFQEESMAYPPSVVVKDYTWNGSTGYLQITGTTEKRYATIIQIVPAPARF